MNSAAARRTMEIALIGNPNTGKTTVFNALCGARQKTGNYPGVTVERKSGPVSLGEGEGTVIDLPGLYSLRAVSRDERVAADAAMGRLSGERHPDVVLFVLDVTNLKRNLFLYSQVAELGLPVVVALTMTDLLEGEGLTLDHAVLSEKLKAPAIAVLPSRPETFRELKRALWEAARNGKSAEPLVDYAPDFQECVTELVEAGSPGMSAFEAQEILLGSVRPEEKPELAGLIHELLLRPAVKRNRPGRVTIDRYRWAQNTADLSEKRLVRSTPTLTQRLDRIFTHRVFGLLAFAAAMFLVFQSIYTGASPLMSVLESGFRIAASWTGNILDGYPMLQSLVGDGIIGGAGSVLVFLPQIAILFAFIAILEDSGYLARAAFLMDRLLGWAGLNGRSFIPMLSSFACAVPGVMASRVIPEEKARIATILVSPLVSCSARLPVYLLLIGAFIEPQYGAAMAALALSGMHVFGVAVAMPIAWVINRGFLRTQSLPFLLELPPYRLPYWRNVLYRVYEATKSFLVRAGTVIFAVSIVIWALSYFPRPASLATEVAAEFQTDRARLASKGDDEALRSLEARQKQTLASRYLEQSFLGRSGKTLEPFFRPMGFDWKITVGILSAFPARETIIATFGIIYAVGDPDENTPALRERMAMEKKADGTPVFTPLTAVSLMVFFALCCQCMSTVATVRRELNSWGWAFFMFFYMTALACVFSLAIYQIGSAFS